MNKNKVKVKCEYCSKEFQKAKSALKNSRSGLYFYCRKHKDLGQRLLSGIDAIHPPHYNTGKYGYRNKVSYEQGCIDCGEKRKYMLVVHHIDGNRDNNNFDNLEVVCQNCHCKRHINIKTMKLNHNHLTDRTLLENL
jgi:hypothetical protein